MENQRIFLDRLKRELVFDRWEDWYQVSPEDFRKYGGGGLLDDVYNGSISKMLTAVYPHHVWHLWRFPRVPVGFWANINHQKDFIYWLEEKLDIKNLKEWSRISLVQIQQFAPTTIFQTMGGLEKILSNIYPDLLWKKGLVRKSSQRILLMAVKELFPYSGNRKSFL